MALVTSIVDSEPFSYEEAANQQVWREAMMEEYSSIMKNDVWEVVPRPEGKSVVTSKWLYKIKHAADGNIKKFKARFVARGFSERLIEGCKRDLASEFEMKDIGLMQYFLGLEVWQEEGNFFLGQGKYIVDILSRFHMEDCKPMSTPMITNWKKLHASDSELVDPTLYRQLIGCLMYLVNTRPDICFAVNTMSQFMCYTDSDWASCASDRKSTSRCCFGLGSAVVSWISQKQQSVALSSVEVEYMAVSLASCEAIWLRKMLFGLFGQALRPSVIYRDNQSCIKLTKNLVFHDRSKHIEIKYHFIRDYVQNGAVKLEYISTNEQVADIFTKALPQGKHVYFRNKMGVVRNTFLSKREY
eukprot:PITA_14750